MYVGRVSAPFTTANQYLVWFKHADVKYAPASQLRNQSRVDYPDLWPKTKSHKRNPLAARKIRSKGEIEALILEALEGSDEWLSTTNVAALSKNMYTTQARRTLFRLHSEGRVNLWEDGRGKYWSVTLEPPTPEVKPDPEDDDDWRKVVSFE
jgi:hypothetical protein